MIKKKTVLVLGAGASAPYDFPVGRTLMFNIIGQLKSISSPIWQTLHSLDYHERQIKEFSEALWKSGFQSVDYFLERRHEYLEIGRAAIAATLIPMEVPKGLLRSEGDVGLYEYIFKFLESELSDFANNQLSVISFNYDRSLEQYLYVTLQSSYGISPEESLKLMGSIPIIHVYGTLGEFDPTNKKGRFYTTDLHEKEVRKAIAGIKILTEGVFNSEDLERARTVIKKAEILCFLGFGYDKTNVDRLKVNELYQGTNEVLGTAFELKNDDITRIKKLINRIALGKDKENSVDFLKEWAILENATVV